MQVKRSNHEDNTLNISLNNAEIEEALVAYIGEQGISISNKAVSVKMTAGRGNNSYSAAIEIAPTTAPVTSITSASEATEIEPVAPAVQMGAESVSDTEEAPKDSAKLFS
jgi:hypothetical protein